MPCIPKFIVILAQHLDPVWKLRSLFFVCQLCGINIYCCCSVLLNGSAVETSCHPKKPHFPAWQHRSLRQEVCRVSLITTATQTHVGVATATMKHLPGGRRQAGRQAAEHTSPFSHTLPAPLSFLLFCGCVPHSMSNKNRSGTKKEGRTPSECSAQSSLFFFPFKNSVAV